MDYRLFSMDLKLILMFYPGWVDHKNWKNEG